MIQFPTLFRTTFTSLLFLAIIIFLPLVSCCQDDPPQYKSTGISPLVQVGFSQGLSGTEKGKTGLAAQAVFSYLFNANFSAGLGATLESFDKTTYTPIFADVRVYLKDKKFTQCALINLGYSRATVSRQPDLSGILLRAGIGVKYHLSYNFSLIGDIAYQIQQLDEKNPAPNTPATETHALTVKVGLSF